MSRKSFSKIYRWESTLNYRSPQSSIRSDLTPVWRVYAYYIHARFFPEIIKTVRRWPCDQHFRLEWYHSFVKIALNSDCEIMLQSNSNNPWDFTKLLKIFWMALKNDSIFSTLTYSVSEAMFWGFFFFFQSNYFSCNHFPSLCKTHPITCDVKPPSYLKLWCNLLTHICRYVNWLQFDCSILSRSHEIVALCSTYFRLNEIVSSSLPIIL